MAFSYTHRKLLISPINSTITTVQTCLYFCNTTKIDFGSTPKGFCPAPCLKVCPSTCHFSLSTIVASGNSTSQLDKSQNLSPLLIFMLILLAFTILLITFYVLYVKLYSNIYPNTPSNFNAQNNPMNFLDGEHGPTRVFHPIWYISTVGLNPTVIKSIKIQTCEKAIEGHDCAVCLGEFIIGDEMRILPKCSHAFHVHCIDTWLKSHVTCPLCRAPIDSGHDQGYGQTCDVSSTTTIIMDDDVVENGNEFHGEDAVINLNSNGEGCLEENEKGSSSQRWCWESGAASLVNKSLSCSGKIFSSRYDNKPRPNPQVLYTGA